MAPGKALQLRVLCHTLCEVALSTHVSKERLEALAHELHEVVRGEKPHNVRISFVVNVGRKTAAPSRARRR